METPGKELDFVRKSIVTPRGRVMIYSVPMMKELGHDIERLPFSIRVLLENALRHSGRVPGATEAAHALAAWPKSVGAEIPFMPCRVLLQDYTGVPLVVDLAAMRDAARGAGLDPRLVDSRVPVDLVIDHSIQVDSWSSFDAFAFNLKREYERNAERYSLLKWAQSAFSGMRVFPPGKGICHQVNLEYLSKVVATSSAGGEPVAFPDTLVGTDSHTTMVNGLGVLGWGVGGIEAEAVMLGEPYHMPVPRVLGVRLTGSLREGVTPTDMVLAVTEKLRQKNVVGSFVEYFGEGFSELSVPDRATMGNMSPEYGATVGFSPVDGATLAYLVSTGRDAEHVGLVSAYCKAQGLMADGQEPVYSEVLEIDLGTIEPSIAGPRNPEERRPLGSVPLLAKLLFQQYRGSKQQAQAYSSGTAVAQLVEARRSPGFELTDGCVVIAAITSCTNTSNPTVMVGAGLLAKKAVEKGLRPRPWVKNSLAPGSTVVTDYLRGAGLLRYLDNLGFSLVGYGCTTCIGNSGPLAPEVERQIREGDIYAVAVLSGNRNFDGRIHPLVRGSFLMSPMLVVAYSLAGRIDFDFQHSPLGTGPDGRPVFLADIWPSLEEIREVVTSSINSALYRRRYSNALEGDSSWNSLVSYVDDVYHWEDNSTYIRRPPWFEGEMATSAKNDIIGARVLAILEDKVTTDHISPAGSIPFDSPAGKYLMERGVDIAHFSTYGSRRGNHEVMVRGGFSNTRLVNLLCPGREGGWTTHVPTGREMTIFDAATEYRKHGVPLLVIAGKQYGTGSSRDWAAKAPRLLGVRAILAESFERIHRSNLIAMGVLPLQFMDGESARTLGLTGKEEFDLLGISSMKRPNESIEVVARLEGSEKKFSVISRIDNQVEMKYAEHGGVLPYVFSKIVKAGH